MRLECFLQILKIQQMRVRSETYRRGSFCVFLEFVKTRKEAEERNKFIILLQVRAAHLRGKPI